MPIVHANDVEHTLATDLKSLRQGFDAEQRSTTRGYTTIHHRARTVRKTLPNVYCRSSRGCPGEGWLSCIPARRSRSPVQRWPLVNNSCTTLRTGADLSRQALPVRRPSATGELSPAARYPSAQNEPCLVQLDLLYAMHVFARQHPTHSRPAVARCLRHGAFTIAARMATMFDSKSVLEAIRFFSPWFDLPNDSLHLVSPRYAFARVMMHGIRAKASRRVGITMRWLEAKTCVGFGLMAQ